jgi:16S rRNA (uracil1498-N3)-methyltransferase
VLSLATGTRGIADVAAAGDAAPDASGAPGAWRVLSGPEGGLSAAEERQALQAGFAPVTLGPRVLRAETAALAALLALAGAPPA